MQDYQEFGLCDRHAAVPPVHNNVLAALRVKRAGAAGLSRRDGGVKRLPDPGLLTREQLRRIIADLIG